MLNNEKSGVPLVHNAAGLKHFFSPRGFSMSGWQDERGTVIAGPWPYSTLNGLYGNQVWWGGYGIVESKGSWAPISTTQDVLIVVSGHRTDSTGWLGENPSLTVRMGASAAGQGTIRIRAPAVIQNFGDQIIDDSGTQIDAPGIPARTPPETGEHYILVGALQRGTPTYWHTVTFREDGSYHQNVSTDLDALGVTLTSITPKTTETGAPAGQGDATIVGKFYAFGIWVFDTLPNDFREASINMGRAWKNGNYTFWPKWGIE